MGDVLTFGPLILKTKWFILAISLASGYWLFHYYLRNSIELREKIKGLLWNALFCFLITWELSPILFRTSLFIKDPIILLYYLPSNKETIFAVVLTMIFLMYQIFREKISFYSVINSIAMIYGVATFIFYFFTEDYGNRVEWGWLARVTSHHPLHIYYMLLFFALTIWLLYRQYDLHSQLLYRGYLSIISLAQLGISLFKSYPYILGIYAYLFWFLFLLTGFVLELFYIFVLQKAQIGKIGG